MSNDLELLGDPAYLPFRLDLSSRRLLLLRLSAEDRRNAAFLDERALPRNPQGAWVAWDEAERESQRCADPALRWIFHIGHCGSTLLSRLLETTRTQALREPLPLRDLATGSASWPSEDTVLAPYLQSLGRLWARPVGDADSTLVKATSSCNSLIGPLLSARADDRIVLLDMPLRPYLATLLKSSASVRDALSGADGRWALLRRRWPHVRMEAPRSAGEACAMGWLAEQVRFEDLEQRGGRALRVDFEQLLAQPRETLDGIRQHFGLDRGTTDSALASNWWGRYAKAGEHAYGPQDRLHDQTLAMSRFKDEIARGVAWVRGVSASHSE